MTDRIIKIGFGVPAYGGKISAEHARMWLLMGHALACSEERFTCMLPVAIIDVCGIDTARNLLMTASLGLCDWLVMIDADTWVKDPHELLAMVSNADRANAAVVVAPVVRRNLDGSRELMVYQFMTDDGKLYSMRDEALGPGPTAIDAAATACMAINMKFAEKLDRPFFRFTATHSEDKDFCLRVRALGGVILADPRVTTYHLNRPAILEGVVR